MPKVLIKRGTRAQIDAAASGNALAAGEAYLITDEGRLAVGTGVGTYAAAAKEGEGAGAAPPVDALSITYTDGRVTAVTADAVTTTVTYNADGTVNTVSYPAGALTRTETYSYTGGVLTGMTAAEA